jgi:hypothetical protein
LAAFADPSVQALAAQHASYGRNWVMAG